MRSLLAAIFFSSVAVLHAQSTNTNWTNRIVSKTEHPLSSLINPHVNPVDVLIIDGKRFEHVRGLNTFYLRVPNTNAIVFIVDNTKDYSVTYHVFMMDSGTDVAIRARSSGFGHTIGSANLRDTIEVDDKGIIVLCTFDPWAKSTLSSLANLDSMKLFYYLDLKKKAIVGEKAVYYDKAGKVIHEHVATPPY